MLKSSMHIYLFVLKPDHNYVQSCSDTFILPSEHASYSLPDEED